MNLNDLEIESICALVQSLPVAELSYLLNSPLLGIDIVEHAAFCEDCAPVVDHASTLAFDELPADQRAEFQHDGIEIAEHVRALMQQQHAKEPAETQARLSRLARKAAPEKGAALGWRIVRAGARQFLDPQYAMPIAAHEKSDPGWPLEIDLGQVVGQSLRVEFDLLGMDLVVKNNSDINGMPVVIHVKTSGDSILVAPSQRSSVGDVSDFGLDELSSKEKILEALMAGLELQPTTARE